MDANPNRGNEAMYPINKIKIRKKHHLSLSEARNVISQKIQNKRKYPIKLNTKRVESATKHQFA